jgi:uncharacterized protein YcgI (DUF1989 family)
MEAGRPKISTPGCFSAWQNVTAPTIADFHYARKQGGSNHGVPMENNPPPSMAGVEGFPRDAALTGSRYAETARGQPRQLAQSFIIPARTGKAFPLMAGKIVRVSCVEGPQVADMIVFNLHDPNEKFWSGRTRVIHGGHLKVGDRLWSVPPQVRPMLTLIAVTAFLSLAL